MAQHKNSLFTLFDSFVIGMVRNITLPEDSSALLQLQNPR